MAETNSSVQIVYMLLYVFIINFPGSQNFSASVWQDPKIILNVSSL